MGIRRVTGLRMVGRGIVTREMPQFSAPLAGSKEDPQAASGFAEAALNSLEL